MDVSLKGKIYKTENGYTYLVKGFQKSSFRQVQQKRHGINIKIDTELENTAPGSNRVIDEQIIL